MTRKTRTSTSWTVSLPLALPCPACPSSVQRNLNGMMLTFRYPPDVLDDFSKPKAQANMQTATPPPSAATTTAASNAEPATGIADADFDEDAFLKQLEKDMASMMSQGGPQADAPDPESFQAAVDQGADAFAKQLEESGVPPGDFLKQLLADVMAEGGGGSGDASSGAAAAAAASAASSAAPPQSQTSTSTEAVEQQKEEQPAESFNDAIQRTINRMKESGDKATAAASSNENDEISDDLLAQLLKAVEAGAAGAGDDGDLTKMFMGMMEQLSNKEMLYEPMKELDGKFEPWIERNKASGKITAEDMERYQTQARVVRQIVSKFEEEGYSDEDPKCREFVWERMQEVSLLCIPLYFLFLLLVLVSNWRSGVFVGIIY